MELRDTEEEAAFRREVREFIAQNLPSSAKTRGARRFGDADRDWSHKLGAAGYAAALAYVLFVVILILTLVQFWLGNRVVHYSS